jgi:hypothetical protein
MKKGQPNDKRPVILETAAALRHITKPEVPSAVAWHLVARSAKGILALEDRHHRQFSRLVAKLGLPIFHLSKLVSAAQDAGDTAEGALLFRRVKLVEAQLASILKEEGIELIDLQGVRWRDVAEGDADIVEYIADDAVRDPLVSESCEPVVKWRQSLVAPGKVIVTGPSDKTINRAEE